MNGTHKQRLLQWDGRRESEEIKLFGDQMKIANGKQSATVVLRFTYSILLNVLLVFSLTACGGGSGNSLDSSIKTAANTKPKTGASRITFGLSAARNQGETSEQALARVIHDSGRAETSTSQLLMQSTVSTNNDTVIAEAKGPTSLSVIKSAFVASDSAVNNLSNTVKKWNALQSGPFSTSYSTWADHFLGWTDETPDDSIPTDYYRRISWRYPDDGCFARAALFNKHLTDAGGPALQKIFVFGNLAVNSPNAIGGSVQWSYHVVPVVQLDDGVYVVDPAINNSGPIKVSDWLNDVVDAADNPSTERKSLKIAICDSNAYDPSSICTGGKPQLSTWLSDDAETYLNDEWDRINNLLGNPVAVLTSKAAPAASFLDVVSKDFYLYF